MEWAFAGSSTAADKAQAPAAATDRAARVHCYPVGRVTELVIDRTVPDNSARPRARQCFDQALPSVLAADEASSHASCQ